MGPAEPRYRLGFINAEARRHPEDSASNPSHAGQCPEVPAAQTEDRSTPATRSKRIKRLELTWLILTRPSRSCPTRPGRWHR